MLSLQQHLADTLVELHSFWKAFRPHRLTCWGELAREPGVEELNLRHREMHWTPDVIKQVRDVEVVPEELACALALLGPEDARVQNAQLGERLPH